MNAPKMDKQVELKSENGTACEGDVGEPMRPTPHYNDWKAMRSVSDIYDSLGFGPRC